MNKRAVLAAIALVALGTGVGFLWRKPESGRAEQPAPAPAQATRTTDREPADAIASAPAPTEKLRVLLNADGNSRPNGPPASASPAELQQRAEIRRKLEELNPGLAAELALTPEQADQFFDLLARQQVEIAALIAARPGNLPHDLRAMELSGNAEQAAMLADKYPEWLQYQEKALQLHPIDQLQGVLGRQSMSLSQSELDSLTTAFVAEQRRLEKEMRIAPVPPGLSPRRELQAQLEQEVQLAAYNRRLVNAASRYLNRQQLTAYEQMLEQRARTADRLLRAMEDLDEE